MRKRGSRVSLSTWAESTTVAILSQLHTPSNVPPEWRPRRCFRLRTLILLTHSHCISRQYKLEKKLGLKKHVYIYTSYTTDNCYWWWKHIHHQSRDTTTGTGKGDGYKHVHNNNNNKRKCNSCNTKRVLTWLWDVIEMYDARKTKILYSCIGIIHHYMV